MNWDMTWRDAADNGPDDPKLSTGSTFFLSIGERIVLVGFRRDLKPENRFYVTQYRCLLHHRAVRRRQETADPSSKPNISRRRCCGRFISLREKHRSAGKRFLAMAWFILTLESVARRYLLATTKMVPKF